MNQKIEILIKLKDSEYAAMMGRALGLKQPAYSIHIDNSNWNSTSLMSKGFDTNEYDIFLVDEEIRREIESSGMAGINKIISMTEGSYNEGSQNYIYKYSGLTTINSKIQLVYAENSGRRHIPIHNKNTNIIGFTSASGGVGVSSIAISTGRELAAISGKSVLYLSFEEIESTSVYFPQDKGKATISEYLYYLFSKENSNISSFIKAFLITDKQGLLTFRPSKGISELPKLDSNTQYDFFNSLLDSSIFDIICVDFYLTLNTGVEQLLQLCKKIFLVDDGLPLSLWKNRKMLNGFSEEVQNAIRDRLVSVSNKWEPDKEYLLESTELYVEQDNESFINAGATIDIELHRLFGFGIRRIADELITEI